MRTWSLNKDDPICLTLSADARFVKTDYSDDQIWDLGWWEQEIPAVWLHTSYGRRTQSMHIFPAFTLGGQTRQDPKTFAEPVILKQVLPNLASLACTPFKEIFVQAEYFVPDSHAIVGRFTLHNLTTSPQVVNLRLSAYLQPGEHANPMGLVEMQGIATLSGNASNIFPVVLMNGGARIVSAAYPSIQVGATLAPGGSKTWVWAHAALAEQQDSYHRCRELIQIPWESTIAHIEMRNARLLSIETGNPDWDTVFWMTQKELLRGFIGPTAHNSRPGLVGRRNVDDGFALTSDGKDHTGPWGGLSTSDTFFLASQALPIAPDLVKDVLRNILRTQQPDGELDWAPGLGGQRAGSQAIPFLSVLAWECYQWTEDELFLDEVFPGLFSFYESWFMKRHDRDEDGYPEWTHALQSGFEIRPLFNRFDPWAQGFDISHAESVDLAAYLYREGQALISMAQVLGREGLTTVIRERNLELIQRVDASWSEKGSSYQHVDRDSHSSHSGLQLMKRRGESKSRLDRHLDPPAKLLLRLKGDPAQAKKLKVDIVGEGARKRKRTEKLTFRKFQSFWEWSTHTTEKLNYRLHNISVNGIDQNLTMEIIIPDLARPDITLALPLWAGWMDGSRAQAMVKNTITNPELYWRRNGLTSVPATDKSYITEKDPLIRAVRMFWSSLIGIGLVENGFREEAGQLFQKLMQAVVETLKQEKSFYSSYHADEAKGIGFRGDLQGLIPIDLFLAILGVRFISPSKVWVEPGHPFPWPVTINWQGLSLQCERDVVYIHFPDGQSVTVEGHGGRFVEQLDSPELFTSDDEAK
jgi:hypothetical protein